MAPLRHYRRTVGLFEVLSAAPYAFDHRDVVTMQLLSSVMVAAMTRLSHMQPGRAPARPPLAAPIRSLVTPLSSDAVSF